MTGAPAMYSVLLTGVALLWLVSPPVVMPEMFPAGMSQNECRSRAFHIWINKDLLGSNPWQLQAMDDEKRPFIVTEVTAAQCGISLMSDLSDNLEIRISFFACPVKILDDLQFNISVQFLVFYPTGVTSYDIAMSCALQEPWSTREIVCAENYVEVSVRRIVPSVVGLPLGIQSAWPVVLARDWFIDFQFRNGSVRTVSATVATQMGYGVKTTSTRVVLRSPHNTTQSQIMEIYGLRLEVTISTMSYKQPWVVLLVDTTTACPVGPAFFTPTSLTWATPAILTPLVLDMQTYHDLGPQMGIDGQLITADTMQQNGYQLAMNNTAVGITVPIGATGGVIKSDVQDNKYGTTYNINLLLERDWNGTSEDSTKHTTYKLITTPFKPFTPIFLSYTTPGMTYFNISLGNFYPDVTISSIAVGGQPLTLDQLPNRGFTLTTVPNGNGTNAFFLQMPFKDLLVEQTVLPGFIRRYILYITYTMTLIPGGKTFTYTDVVHEDVQDVVPPTYTGSCGTRTLIVDMTHGSMDKYWVPYVNEIPLTVDLISSQNYIVSGTGSTFHLEAPLLSVGLVYEAVTLQWTRARLDFFLKDNQTLEIMSSFSVSCNFSTGRMLLCLPNGTMIATVLSSDTQPNLDARKTHLRDPSCQPVQATSSMALFYFSVSTCGTKRLFDATYVLYENEILFDREMIPVGAPIISRDSEYIWKESFWEEDCETCAKSSAENGQRYWDAWSGFGDGNCGDGSFNAFYSAWEFPVMKRMLHKLFFEVNLLQNGVQQAVVLEECWATPTADKDDATQWHFISRRCAVDGASYKTSLKLSPAENLKHFAVKTLPSEEVNGMEGPNQLLNARHNIVYMSLALYEWATVCLIPPSTFKEKVYIHCLVTICDGSLAGKEACLQTCNPSLQTEVAVSSTVDEVMELVSLGPVEILAQEDVVSSRYSGEQQRLTWPWLLSVGLAVIGVLAVASVILALRMIKC